MKKGFLSIVALVFLPLAFCKPASGEERAEESPPLIYRRILVPADRMADWPMGDGKYLPLETGEFERLTGQLKAAGNAAPPAGSPRIGRAEYRATLDGDRLLTGQADLEIALLSDSPVLIPLEPCNLAIRNPIWIRSSAEKTEKEERQNALLGTTPRGKIGVLAERGGKLRFDWSLRGRRDVNGNLLFSGEIPAASASTLAIDLPGDMLVQAEDGIAVGAAQTDEASETKKTTWRVELGGNGRFQLKLTPRVPRDSSGGLPLLTETRTYEISPRGADVSIQWKIQDRGEPLRQIAAIVDPELKLIAARCGETAIDWTLEPPSEGKSKRAIFNLPPSVEAGQTVRLSAIAPLTRDRLWRLPRIRPEGAAWESGTIGVAVLRPLSIDRLSSVGCSQTSSSPLAEPRAGESMQFQIFNSDATVAVSLGQQRGELSAKLATAVEIGNGEITARTVGDFQSSDSPQFAVGAKVAPAWRIDDVAAVPADALADWNLETGPDGARKLSIRLAKPIGPEFPVRLIVGARRLRLPAEKGIKLLDLQPLQFAAPVESRRWLTLKTVGANELKIQGGDQPRRISLADLTPAERTLFDNVSGEMIFADNAAAEAEVLVESRRPEYSATLRTEIEAEDGRLLESWSLRCTPESAQVERILVQFSEKCDITPHWKMAGAEGVELAARRWSLEEAAAAGLGHAAEIWEIALSRPQNVLFEVQGSRETPFAEPRPANLIALPEASRQNATLVVRRTAKSSIRIDNRRLSGLPPEPPTLESLPTVLATFDYEPEQDAAASKDPPLVLAPDDRRFSSACAWSALLESWHEPSGVARYAAVWELQLGGRDQAKITLPGGIDSSSVTGVWIDERAAVWKPILDIVETAEYANPNSFTVALPAEKRFATLSVEFAARNEPLGATGTIASRLPAIDLPVLSSAWGIWLPRGFEAAGGQSPGTPLFAPQVTLDQRLLGPLGRSVDERRFRIFSAEDWASIAGDPQRARSRKNLDRILFLLNESLEKFAASRQNASISWRELLSSLEKPPVPRLLIDCPSLDRLRISGHLPLPASLGEGASNRVEELLQTSRLALLASGDSVLLTSQARASLYTRQWSSGELSAAGLIAPGPLADRLTEAWKDESERRYLPARIWSQLSAKPESPWNRSHFSAFEPFELLGWNVARRDLPVQETVAIAYVHRTTFRLAAWVIFFTVAACGAWILSRRLPILLGLAVVFAMTALVLSEPYVILASSALLGTLFSLIIRRAFRKRTAQDAVKQPETLESTVWRTEIRPGGSASGSAAKLLLLFAASSMAYFANAEEPPKKEPPAYRVFVPVDAEKKPQGDKIYVPEKFYDELYRRAEAVSEKPSAWLLTLAAYRGALVRDSATGQMTLDAIKAQFDLHTFGRAVEVRMPVLREEVDPAAGVLLDGRPRQIQWDAEGASFSFAVDEPGDYRLEISLRPKIRSVSGRAGFDASIPPAAGARLELLLPSDPPAVKVCSAAGKVTQENEPPRIVADLGPARRLAVDWPESGPAAVAEIDEFIWLKVQPGSVVLDVRLKGNAAAGRLEKLQLAVDSRLRLQQLSGPDAPTVQIENASDRTQIVSLAWPRPLPEQSTIALSFLVAGASGVGNLHLPAVEVRQILTGKRWLAVSVDPLLDYEPQWLTRGLPELFLQKLLPEGRAKEQSATKAEPFATNEFLKAWGASAAAPLAAYRLGPAVDWSISTKPRESLTTAQPELTLSFDRDRADVEFTAQLTTVSGYVFQHRLAGPKELSVRSVSLKKDGVEMASRFARDADGTITVFLTGPAEGRQELKIRGTLPLAGKTKLSIPSLKLSQTGSESTLVRVYRRPGVLVDPTPPAGAVSESTLADASRPDWRTYAERGRLVLAYRVEEKSPTFGQIDLKPNRPNFKARQVVWIRQEDRQWIAGVDCRVQVIQGVLDEMHLDVAPAWKGPYDISTAAAVDAAGAAGEWRRLSIVPSEAVAGEYAFRLSGPIKFEQGQRPALPLISLRQADELERWAALPRFSQGQDLMWQLGGMNEVKMPDWIAADFDPKVFHACEVVVENPKAALSSQGQNAADARIGLADIRLAWQSNGAVRGVATFDLTPGGVSTCPLKLPKDCELIAATVDGLPAEPQSLSDGGWRLPLNSDRLSQRVAVICRGKLAEADRPAEHEFEAPTLGDISVDRTLWTIAGPSRYRPGECGEKESPDALRRHWIRFQLASESIEATAGQFSVDNERSRRWYQLAVRQWAATRSALIRQWLPISQTEAGRAMQKEIESLEKRQSQFAERLEVSDILRQALAAPPIATEPAEWWDDSLFDSAAATGIYKEGRLASVSLTYTTAQTSQVWPRIGYALLILVVAALVIWVIRRGFWDEMVRLFPASGHIAAAVLGLFWWLCLSPSWFGLVIILVSAASWGWAWRYSHGS